MRNTFIIVVLTDVILTFEIYKEHVFQDKGYFLDRGDSVVECFDKKSSHGCPSWHTHGQ